MRRLRSHRRRPDNLRTEVRAAKRGRGARFLYLGLLGLFVLILVNTLIGELLTLQGEGMVTRQANVVTPAFDGTVDSLRVEEGDRVEAGKVVVEMTSRQMRDRMTAIRTRMGAAKADLATAEAEIDRIQDLLPSARQALSRTRIHQERLEDLRGQGLSTNAPMMNVAREVYDARKEIRTLESELTAAGERREIQKEAVTDASAALTDARERYGHGLLSAGTTGLVTEVTVREGAFVQQGDPVVEVMHGDPHVVAYLPAGSVYYVAVNDRVILRYGMRTAVGRIIDLNPVARRPPAEFEETFQATERRRIVRIRFVGGSEIPPLFTKVAVTSPYAPRTILARIIFKVYRTGAAIPETIGYAFDYLEKLKTSWSTL